jgi:hypothetical protein
MPSNEAVRLVPSGPAMLPPMDDLDDLAALLEAKGLLAVEATSRP